MTSKTPDSQCSSCEFSEKFGSIWMILFISPCKLSRSVTQLSMWLATWSSVAKNRFINLFGVSKIGKKHRNICSQKFNDFRIFYIPISSVDVWFCASKVVVYVAIWCNWPEHTLYVSIKTAKKFGIVCNWPRCAEQRRIVLMFVRMIVGTIYENTCGTI